MSQRRNLNRREFLRCASLSAMALVTGSWLSGRATSSLPDLEIALRATASEVSILPGQPTRVWTYQGEVLRGNPTSLQALPGSYLGPIIRARQGQRVRIRFTNNLPEKTVIHWHGLYTPERMDGHPRDVIGPGQSYVYEFPVINRAGTYWFHPHPHGRTGPQVYSGLAGLFLVSDDEETQAGLPSGEYDLPLIIQDRTFDTSNQLVYSTGGMGMMDGFLGERILVNGHPNFTLSVATRAYRLRLLNGSNSRIYKLAWSDGTPLIVIGTDGGLLETPVPRSYVMLAPGERIELWADFSQRPVGTEIVLQSLAFSGAEVGMGGMMGGGQPLPNGAPFPVLKVRVERQEPEALTLPTKLSAMTRYRPTDAVNYSNPRTFAVSLSMMGMMQVQWLLNERPFQMEEVAPNEKVKLNTLEMWEFVNETTPMAMAHPIHIHGPLFQIIERQVRPDQIASWETVRAGYVDEGWRDTVLLMPGERVKVLLKFENYTGLYVYHCHNLEHEDAGMMRNYLVST